MSCCEDFPFWLDTNVLISLSLRRPMSTGATMPPVAEFDNVVMSATMAVLALVFTPWAFAMAAGCAVMRLAAVV